MAELFDAGARLWEIDHCFGAEELEHSPMQLPSHAVGAVPAEAVRGRSDLEDHSMLFFSPLSSSAGLPSAPHLSFRNLSKAR